MASAMKYLLRTADGKEYGPTDQDTLIKWAQAGRVTTECKIRNALMKKWHDVSEFKFLTEYVVEEDSGAAKKSKFAKPEQSATPHSLTKAGTFKCVPSNAALRGIAWLVDHLILGVVWAVLFIGTVQVQGQLTDANIKPFVWLGFTLVFLFIYLLYFAFMLGLKAQTVGQWFAGIMIIREKGGPVLMGRALIWTVLYMIFGITTVFFAFVVPGKRAIQDMLTRTRVVNITVRDLA